MEFIKKLGMFGEFALLFMIAGMFHACKPERKCSEFGYLDRVTITQGFYKGHSGIVVKGYENWEPCERPYFIKLDSTGIEVRIDMDDGNLIRN